MSVGVGFYFQPLKHSMFSQFHNRKIYSRFSDENLLQNSSDTLASTVKISASNNKAFKHEKSCKQINIRTSPICTGC